MFSDITYKNINYYLNIPKKFEKAKIYLKKKYE